MLLVNIRAKLSFTIIAFLAYAPHCLFELQTNQLRILKGHSTISFKPHVHYIFGFELDQTGPKSTQAIPSTRKSWRNRVARKPAITCAPVSTGL